MASDSSNFLLSSDSLFRSKIFSDIKLKVIGSDDYEIIFAHKAILVQNSDYFRAQFNFLKWKPMRPDEALVVDVSEEGILQEGLDVLQIFYLSFGKFISVFEGNYFEKLNPKILEKFLFKDIEFVEKKYF